MTNQSAEQLALFMNARDVRDYGTAAWADLDLPGQEAYLTDAAAFVSAMKALGWTPPAGSSAPQSERSDAMTGEIRGLAFEDGIDRGPDCGDDECECFDHEGPQRRAGTYITIRLDGSPRVGLWPVRVERVVGQEAQVER